MITRSNLVVEAAALLSVHGENAEYDRGIVELTTRLLGYSDDQQSAVRTTLRLINPIELPEAPIWKGDLS